MSPRLRVRLPGVLHRSGPAQLTILAACALLPVAAWPSLHYVYQLPKLIVFYGACAVVLLIGFVALAGRGEWRLRPAGPDIAFLILLVWLGLAALTSAWPRAALLGTPPRFEGWLSFLGYGVFYAVSRRSRSGALRAFGWAIAVSVAIVGFLAFLELQGWYHPIGFRSFGVRAVSTMGNPIYVGALAALALPITLALLLSSERLSVKALLGGLTGLQTIGLVASGSRAAWLAAAAALLLPAGALSLGRFLRRGGTAQRRRVAMTALAVGVLATALAGAVTLGLGGASDGAPSPTRAGLTDASAQSRLVLWRATIGLITEHPLLGWGPESFLQQFPRVRPLRLLQLADYTSYADRPHNHWLYLAYAGGIPALAAYLAFLLLLLWRGMRTLFERRSSRYRSLAVAACLGAIAGYEIQAFFSFSLPMIAPLAAVIQGGLVALTRPRRPRPAPERAALGNAGGRRSLPRLALGRKGCVAGAVVLLGLSLPFVSESVRLLGADYLYMKAAREPWDAPALLSRSVSLAPRDPLYPLALGEAYRRLAKDDPRLLGRAEAAYRHGLAQQPPSPDLMIALAETQSARNDAKGAEATYRSLLARDPLQPAALLGLARVLVATGRPGEALPLLERRAQYAAQDPRGWLVLGRAREATGSIDAARAAYEKVVRLDPGDQEAQAALHRLGR